MGKRDKASYGQWLRCCRQTLGLTQAEFSERIGVSVCTLKRYEQDKSFAWPIRRICHLRMIFELFFDAIKAYTKSPIYNNDYYLALVGSTGRKCFKAEYLLKQRRRAEIANDLISIAYNIEELRKSLLSLRQAEGLL